MQKENLIHRAIFQKPYQYLFPKKRKIPRGNVYIVEFIF